MHTLDMVFVFAFDVYMYILGIVFFCDFGAQQVGSTSGPPVGSISGPHFGSNL